MKLHLVPVRMQTRPNKPPRAWAVHDEHGNDRGVVRRRPRRYLPYHLRGRHMHTLFPNPMYSRGTPEKLFQTISEVRAFIADNPGRYWSD